jgi:hypothetical protein
MSIMVLAVLEIVYGQAPCKLDKENCACLDSTRNIIFECYAQNESAIFPNLTALNNSKKSVAV